MRLILSFLVALTIAIVGGAASVWYALGAIEGVGALRIGNWTAYPASGTPRIDPYAKARLARDGNLPLGLAEGIAFFAGEDAAGRPLRGTCRYRIEGNVPVTRFWTLHARSRPAPGEAEKVLGPGLHSRQILRRADDSFEATVSGTPAPGNWLAIRATAPFQLVLTLYDTPVANGSDARDLEMPVIERIGCDG